jgi:hypothetical protein
MKQVLGVDVQPTEVKMRVLDIPPIDMTDGASSPTAVAAAPAKKTRRSPTAKRATRPAKMAAPKRTRDGSVGRETFQAVEALVKQGKSKSGAFKQVAADTGKKVGAVSANYYRVARARGAVKPRKRTVRPAPAPATRRAPAARRERPASVSVDQVIRQLLASVAALTEAVRAQDAEVRELRGRLERVRQPLR